MTNKEETIELIEEILMVIRPYIQNDGGDVEFVGLRDDGVVQIRLLGACVGCGLADVTVTQGIEQSLIEEVPGIIGVELIQDNWW
ncbi:MAG: NifU family protein [Mycoplasmatales bacterium]